MAEYFALFLVLSLWLCTVLVLGDIEVNLWFVVFLGLWALGVNSFVKKYSINSSIKI